MKKQNRMLKEWGTGKGWEINQIERKVKRKTREKNKDRRRKEVKEAVIKITRRKQKVEAAEMKEEIIKTK